MAYQDDLKAAAIRLDEIASEISDLNYEAEQLRQQMEEIIVDNNLKKEFVIVNGTDAYLVKHTPLLQVVKQTIV